MKELSVLVCIAFSVSCSSAESGPESNASAGAGGGVQQEDESVAVTVSVTPEEGGSVHTETGYELVIPPGAVESTISVTLTPVSAGALLSAVSLEPHGLKLQVPGRLTLPLSSDWEPGSDLPGATFDASPADFVASYEHFIVDVTGLKASGPLYGFSGHGVAKNCHAGSRDYLLDVWQGDAGRDMEARAEELGLDSAELSSCQFRQEPLQRLVTPFLQPCYEFEPNESFSSVAQADIEARLKRGEQVLFLFGRTLSAADENGVRSGVLHSGVGVLGSDGRVLIQNQLNVGDEVVRALPAGATVVRQPLSDIDATATGLRDLRAGEPGAIWIDKRPPSPDERAGEDQRIWSHVAVLCERPREAQANGFSASIEIDGVSVPFTARQVFAAAQGEYSGSTNVTGIPAIEVIDGDASGVHGQIGLLMDARQISEGFSMHALGPPDAVFDAQDPEATLTLVSDQFLNADDGSEVIFFSSDGSITFSAFGNVTGANISGELSATLDADQVVGLDSSGEPIIRSVSGTIQATFDVRLE